jgi:hypothetical protein
MATSYRGISSKLAVMVEWRLMVMMVVAARTSAMSSISPVQTTKR